MIAARQVGHRVEDTSQENAFGHTYANPDGTWTTDEYTGPVQVQDGDGVWQPIDPSLTTTAAGGIKPTVSAADVVFGGGGSTKLATMTVDGKPVTWTWPTTLPTPTIDGASATYKLDDTEQLVLTATSNGFSQDMVLLKAPPSVWQMPTPTISGAAGDVGANSTMTFKTPAGDSLVTSSAPFAFDSSRDAAGEPAISPLAATLTPITAIKQKLSLTPVASFLAAKSTVYPVTIDPSYQGSSSASLDTWIQTPDYRASQYTSPELKVGTYDGGTDVARTFLKLGNTTWTGKSITSAKLTMRNFYSSSCNGSAVRVAQVTTPWSEAGIGWGNQPSWTSTDHVDLSAAHGYNSSCAAADAVWDITGIAQNWAGGDPQYGVVIKAVDETDSLTWRRYRSTEYGSTVPKITYTYNSVPTTPAAPRLTTSPASNAGYSLTTTPTFTAVPSDPDGGQVRSAFRVSQGTTDLYTGWSGYVANNSTAKFTMPAGILANGGTYTVKANSNDGALSSAAWSPVTTFTVDTSKPSTTISASGFTNGQWLSTAPASNTITLTGPTDTKSFSYQKDTGTWTTVAASSGKATFSWLPSGGHGASAYAVDAAGNRGATSTFTFGVGETPSFDAPGADTPSTGSFPLSIEGPSGASSAAFSWRYAGAATWNPMSSIDTASGGGAWYGTSLANTSGKSYTPALIWDATSETDPAKTDGATLSAPALVEIRGCFTYPGAASDCTTPRDVQLVPSAFGGNFPTTNLGPAQVALFTGEMSLSDTDAADQQAGVGRSFSSFDASTAAASGIFGPGWSTGIGASSDSAMEVIDDRGQDRTFVLVGDGDASQIFTPLSASDDVMRPTGPVKFVPAGTDDGSLLMMSKDKTTLTLTRPYGDTTVWTNQTPGDATSGDWEFQSAAGLDGSSTDMSSAGGYPTFIAETAPGDSSTCTPTTQDPGCRALKILYTGTGSSQRVSEIDLIRSGKTPLPVATYSYTGGLLTKVCGPDPDNTGPLPALCGSYSYDTTTVQGRTLLANLTRPGQAAWTFHYDTQGRLTIVTRPLDGSSGTATWSADYTLPVSGNSDMPNLSPATTQGWGETDSPTKVYAVYGPSAQGSGVHRAALFYTDDAGNTVNTATYGDVTTTTGSDQGTGTGPSSAQWSIATNWYDDGGNVTQTLDPAGLQAALADSADEATIAYQRSSLVVYNDAITGTINGTSATIPAGTRVEDEYGPAHLATLRNGTSGEYRAHTKYYYDDEAPSLGGTQKPDYTADDPSWGLVVQTDSNAVSASDMNATFDTTSTRNTYGPLVTGDGSGWTFGTPSQTSILKADGTWATTGTTRLGADGDVIESRQPGGATDAAGAGSDAHATVTSYYATTSADPDCQITGHTDRAGWEGLVCKSKPAARPAGPVANPIPMTWNQSYDDDLQPLVVKETSGTTTRTTTMVYDDLQRPTKITVDDGHDVRVQNIGYDPTTGQQASITGTGSSTDTGGAISSTFDTWGRATSYTDASGATTSTSYTIDGAPSQVTDTNGTTIYGYTNGVLTSMNTTAGTGSTTFNVAYDADGDIATLKYGDALTATYGYDEAGNATSIDYVDSTGTEVAYSANTVDVNGKVVGAASSASSQQYSYDTFGRLTSVQDTRDNACTTRTYGFDATSDRTTLDTYGAAADGSGSCQTATASGSRTWAYDDANRITSTGYTYDNLGRTLTVPKADTNAAGDTGAGALSVGYYANDMVASLTQTITGASGTAETDKDTYALDASGRIDNITSSANGTEVRTQSYQFGDDSDSPTAITTHTDAVGATPASTTTTRYVALGGLGMIASADVNGITYQLQNLHGDTVATAGATGIIGSRNEADEYGNSVAAPAPGSQQTRYGYLGGAQRAAGSVGGVVLMGDRLFNPRSGQFLSPDSVMGGNETRFSYPEDPINFSDVTGDCSGVWGCLKSAGKAVWHGVTSTGKFVKRHWVFVATVGMVAVQFIPIVDGVADLAFGADLAADGLSAGEASAELSGMTSAEEESFASAISPDKLGHIFVPKHNLGPLVDHYGSEVNVVKAVAQAVHSRSIPTDSRGVYSISRFVAGYRVHITGAISGGKTYIGNFWIP